MIWNTQQRLAAADVIIYPWIDRIVGEGEIIPLACFAAHGYVYVYMYMRELIVTCNETELLFITF